MTLTRIKFRGITHTISALGSCGTLLASFVLAGSSTVFAQGPSATAPIDGRVVPRTAVPQSQPPQTPEEMAALERTTAAKLGISVAELRTRLDQMWAEQLACERAKLPQLVAETPEYVRQRQRCLDEQKYRQGIEFWALFGLHASNTWFGPGAGLRPQAVRPAVPALRVGPTSMGRVNQITPEALPARSEPLMRTPVAVPEPPARPLVTVPRGGRALDAANFAQRTWRNDFSEGGRFAGRTVEEVARDLYRGTLKPQDVPIEVVERGGAIYILNTRSATALETAAIPRSMWRVTYMTGDAGAEQRLTQQLAGRGMPHQGVRYVRPAGSRAAAGNGEPSQAWFMADE